MVQLPQMLYALAEQIDGRRGYPEIAQALSEQIQRDVGAEDVEYLVDEKLRPLGVVASPDGTTPQQEKLDPLLALKFRAALVPKSVTHSLTTIFYPLFHPISVVLVLGALVAVDVWFFGFHGVAQPLRALAYNPVLLMMVLGLVVLATALHEIGHATATRYGGAEPGVMGAGIYIVWPAFYTDVTDAYRLDRKGRLRVDLGGIYFNVVFILLVVGAYAVTGFEPLLVLILVQHMQILQQLLPFLRLDGYYILSDLTGVPDMFARIKPTLKSAIPGKDTEDAVEELKPWVRRVTLAWVLFLIPVLLLVFGMMLFNSPRMIATAWDSLGLQWDRIQEGGALNVLSGVVQSLALALPLAGLTYTTSRVVGKMGMGAWGWSEGSALRRTLVVASSAAMALVAAYVLYPNGEYKPIQADERGTLQGGVAQLSAVRTGRPALTERREQDLGGAPTVRSGGVPRPDINGSTKQAPSPASPASTAPAATTGSTSTSTSTEPVQTTSTPAATESTPTDTTSTVPAETTTTVPAETTTTPTTTTP
ncbi:MAG: putative peptide zinc metalloprotease protein [Gaiellaceae bacterium]|jgi:putative peptide zinc metalloprotease protein|nr:putative peptide zinc metalloprotease protein [Gaiellaceae bacterium]